MNLNNTIEFISSFSNIAQTYLEQKIILQVWCSAYKYQSNIFCSRDLRHKNCDKSLAFLFFSG